MSIEIQTDSGIAVIEKVDPSPAKTNKSALARFDAMSDRFDELATDRMPSKLFLSLLATRLMAEPKLLQCRFDTLVRAAIQCHAWGLDPTGKNNGAFLIPYKGECQLQLGYGAMIDLVTREGKITDIDAQIVYDQDTFEVEMGSSPKIIHKPNLKSSRRGRSDGVAYYAVATFASGNRKFAVMTRAEVDEVRAKFTFGSSPSWKSSFDQMALKTVIHRLVKTLPVNFMASQAMAYDNNTDYRLPTAEESEEELTDEQKARVRALQGVEEPIRETPAQEQTPIEPKKKTGTTASEENLEIWLESQPKQ